MTPSTQRAGAVVGTAGKHSCAAAATCRYKPGGRHARTTDAVAPCQKFSKVSTLPNILCTITVKLTFAEFHLSITPPTPTSPALHALVSAYATSATRIQIAPTSPSITTTTTSRHPWGDAGLRDGGSSRVSMVVGSSKVGTVVVWRRVVQGGAVCCRRGKKKVGSSRVVALVSRSRAAIDVSSVVSSLVSSSAVVIVVTVVIVVVGRMDGCIIAEEKSHTDSASVT